MDARRGRSGNAVRNSSSDRTELSQELEEQGDADPSARPTPSPARIT
jgi:hypothetical protein